MYRAFLPCCATITLCCAQALAGEPNREPRSDDIKALIAQLRSPNQPPKVLPEAGPQAEYSAGYDRKAQEKVDEARRKLRDFGPAAIPCLALHSNDTDYSDTVDDGAFDRNLTVGEECHYLIESQLMPLAQSSSFPTRHPEGASVQSSWPSPRYVRAHNLYDPKSAEEWWKQRRNKSLHDIQIEVLEWTTNELKKTSDPERAALQAKLKALRQTVQPLKPEWYLWAK